MGVGDPTRTAALPTRLRNWEIAEVFERVGDLLEAQRANPFRVKAYHRAAGILRNLDAGVGEILESQGVSGLQAIPGIGASLASAAEELALTGRLGLLDRLEGQVSPEDLFTTIPGIGEKLAARIHDTLHIDTLEELELAAADGRLQTVPGFGPRRVRSVQGILATTLSRSARRRSRQGQFTESPRNQPGRHGSPRGQHQLRPSVDLILDVDSEYRGRADKGQLRLIRPRRFNPQRKAWLPILHTERGGWWFTALFSNSRRAHQLGRTLDWVVIHSQEDGAEDQCTVVTEYQGELAGRRVVRGRELECYDFYYPPRRADRQPIVAAPAHEEDEEVVGPPLQPAPAG